jgi:WD40 repeat protein
VRVEGLHGNDINCVSWNSEAVELVATGDSDGVVRVFDTRCIGKALHTLGPGGSPNLDESSEGGSDAPSTPQRGHTGNVLTLQWMPHSTSILASGGEDCMMLVWDIAAGVRSESGGGGEDGSNGAAVVFAHPGHRHTLVDIDWNTEAPGVAATISEPNDGGSKLQMWRVSPVAAEGWLVPGYGHAIGGIAAENTQLSVTRNLSSFERSTHTSSPTGGSRGRAGRPRGGGRGGSPTARRGGLPSAGSRGGGQGRGNSNGITVINAALAVLTSQDPTNQGINFHV